MKNQPTSSPLPLTAMALAVLVSVCWGGNFAASKFSLMDFPPFLSVLLRFLLVSAVLLPFALRAPRLRWRDAWALSLLYITLHFALIFFAMSAGLNVTSTIIASQMGVPFSCLLAAIFFRDYLGPWRSFGLMLSFFGLLLVAGTPNVNNHWGPFLLAIIGAFAWAAANTYMKIMPKAEVVPMLFWPALFAIPQMLLLTLTLESNHLHILETAHTSSWLGIIYSGLMSSIVGYGVWVWLLSRYAITRVVPFSLLIPVVGIACGVLIFNETLTPLILSGAALTILGVAIITLRRPKLTTIDRS